MHQSSYLSGATQVLWAGRALDDALDAGDEVEVQAALAELLRASQARESPEGAVQGFEPAPGEPGEPASTDEDLTRVLAELDLGQALLAAGHAVGEEGAPPTSAPLGHALDQFESDARLFQAAGEPAVRRFAAESDAAGPPLDLFRARFDATVGAVVTRTIGIGTEVVKGLTLIPASTLQPWLMGTVTALGSFPQVGPIVKAGLRAVRRAVAALERLIPEAIRKELHKLAERWWGERKGAVVKDTARRLLGVS
jgi:hypothetical protein